MLGKIECNAFDTAWECGILSQRLVCITGKNQTPVAAEKCARTVNCHTRTRDDKVVTCATPPWQASEFFALAVSRFMVAK